jgi:hypothetical protein
MPDFGVIKSEASARMVSQCVPRRFADASYRRTDHARDMKDRDRLRSLEEFDAITRSELPLEEVFLRAFNLVANVTRITSESKSICQHEASRQQFPPITKSQHLNATFFQVHDATEPFE